MNRTIYAVTAALLGAGSLVSGCGAGLALGVYGVATHDDDETDCNFVITETRFYTDDFNRQIFMQNLTERDLKEDGNIQMEISWKLEEERNHPKVSVS